MYDAYKKYTTTKKIGNKGAAFVEYHMTDYCLMNKIDEAKDVGIDYFCEWVFEEKPSGVIFLAQIKTRDIESNGIKIEEVCAESKLNGLREVNIKGANCDIDDKNINYWKNTGLPVFLILVLKDKSGRHLCFYKRFTPILHGTTTQEKENFYELNNANTFFAFKKKSEKRAGGFARDLFIDHTRCNYEKGSLYYKNPRDLGLEQFPEENTYFEDLLKIYKNKIDNTLSKLGLEIKEKESSVSQSTSTSSGGIETRLIED